MAPIPPPGRAAARERQTRCRRAKKLSEQLKRDTQLAKLSVITPVVRIAGTVYETFAKKILKELDQKYGPLGEAATSAVWAAARGMAEADYVIAHPEFVRVMKEVARQRDLAFQLLKTAYGFAATDAANRPKPPPSEQGDWVD